MELTRVERAILSNQLRILEVLNPEEAASLNRNREALEAGYEWHYEECLQQVCEETMTTSECEEVFTILNMFSLLRLALQRLEEMPDVKKEHVTYRGFDGNNEFKQLSYAKWFCEQPGCRFTVLQPGLNSHGSTLDTYRRQLRAWKESQDECDLSAEDVRRIAQAFIWPGDA